MKTTDERHIRCVRFSPYMRGAGPRFTLHLWDTRTMMENKCRLAYRLSMHEHGKSIVLFEGGDYGCSPLHAIDSDEACAGIMGFLTLRPGDTDAEYFDDYSPAQMEYAEQHAEALSGEVYCRFEGGRDTE